MSDAQWAHGVYNLVLEIKLGSKRSYKGGGMERSLERVKFNVSATRPTKCQAPDAEGMCAERGKKHRV